MTIKKVIRIICILLEIICLLPTITVSCSDETVKLSAINAVSGYENADGSGLFIVLFILPVFTFIIMLAANELGDRPYYFGAAVPIVLDMFAWNAFKQGVIDYAQEEGYGTYIVDTTNWYTFNQVLMITIIVLCVVKVIWADFDIGKVILINPHSITPVVNTEKAGRKINNVKETMMAVSGAAVEAAKEQKEKHAKEELERRLEQERIAQLRSSQNDEGNAEVCFCTQCGKQIHTAMNFCKYCGTKLK